MKILRISRLFISLCSWLWFTCLSETFSLFASRHDDGQRLNCSTHILDSMKENFVNVSEKRKIRMDDAFEQYNIQPLMWSSHTRDAASIGQCPTDFLCTSDLYENCKQEENWCAHTFTRPKFEMIIRYFW